MIYVTGDIHGDPVRLSEEILEEQKDMTKEDYVIVLGDFGLVWDFRGESKDEKYWLDWLEDKPFTTLFIDGNHENFTRLNSYPVEIWHGGKTHAIRPSVRHLMRGECFELEGKKIWAFGGARSHDIQDGILDPVDDIDKIRAWRYDLTKLFRINGVSWWKEEMPNESEMQWGREILARNDNKVDFILTHDCPASIKRIISCGWYETDALNLYLEDIAHNTEFTAWLYGHNHIDRKDLFKFVGLYEQIARIL